MKLLIEYSCVENRTQMIIVLYSLAIAQKKERKKKLDDQKYLSRDRFEGHHRRVDDYDGNMRNKTQA